MPARCQVTSVARFTAWGALAFPAPLVSVSRGERDTVDALATTLTPTPSHATNCAGAYPGGVGRGLVAAKGQPSAYFPGALEMAEAITIDDQELAIICDLMAGWGAKSDGKLDGNKRQALDQVIAKGFVEPSEEGRLRDTDTQPKPHSFWPNSASE